LFFLILIIFSGWWQLVWQVCFGPLECVKVSKQTADGITVKNKMACKNEKTQNLDSNRLDINRDSFLIEE
tara:strand:- start:206 stop:415 length:210 start_codon:yes stop_codon:yes gene_type:complete